jgi:hypothetical protein
MEAVSLTLYRYKLSTTVNVRTGARIPWVDPDLDNPPPPPPPTQLPARAIPGIPPSPVAVPRMAEFVLEVILDGLPLGEVIPAPEDSPPHAQPEPDALRRYAMARLARLKPVLTRELEEEIRRLAKRHMGERGWMIDTVEIEIGSMKLTAGFLIGLEVFTNYGAVRESMERLHDDIVTYAIPAGQQIAGRLLHLDAKAVGSAASGQAMGAAQPAKAAEAGQRYALTSADPEVSALLNQVLGELRELRAVVGKREAEDRLERMLQERADQVRAAGSSTRFAGPEDDVRPGS